MFEGCQGYGSWFRFFKSNWDRFVDLCRLQKQRFQFQDRVEVRTRWETWGSEAYTNVDIVFSKVNEIEFSDFRISLKSESKMKSWIGWQCMLLGGSALTWPALRAAEQLETHPLHTTHLSGGKDWMTMYVPLFRIELKSESKMKHRSDEAYRLQEEAIHFQEWVVLKSSGGEWVLKPI